MCNLWLKFQTSCKNEKWWCYMLSAGIKEIANTWVIRTKHGETFDEHNDKKNEREQEHEKLDDMENFYGSLKSRRFYLVAQRWYDFVGDDRWSKA